ncbi:MAG TPA: hypothetical protein VJ906_09075 [Roseovarius sp.]|nr:hypothetical protein [Roseovarius sp.]
MPFKPQNRVPGQVLHDLMAGAIAPSLTLLQESTAMFSIFIVILVITMLAYAVILGTYFAVSDFGLLLDRPDRSRGKAQPAPSPTKPHAHRPLSLQEIFKCPHSSSCCSSAPSSPMR